jgi:hypothetical protein
MSSGPPVSPAHGAFHPRPSLPAIVLTGAMVAAAVLFGIYGPSIALVARAMAAARRWPIS